MDYFDKLAYVDFSAILPDKPRKKIGAHTSEVTCVSYTKTGLVMATGSVDKSMSNDGHFKYSYSIAVRLWDAPTGQSKAILSGSAQSVMYVEFSPSDELVAAACNDNACRIWSVDTCRLRHTLTGHTEKVKAQRGDSRN